jgi:hypothetical protein
MPAHPQQEVERMNPEETVRAYFTAYEGHPERFDDVVAADYIDYGHEPPGRGPQGARDDYEHAVATVGGNIAYDIDALVAGDDAVAVAWTGRLPNGSTVRGLSLYRVEDGKVTETRHTSIGPPPGAP